MESNVTYFEISPKQVRTLLELARVGRRDTFFELGCAKGLAVRLAISERNARLAVGVELNYSYYETARKLAIRTMSKSQLLRTNFWLGNMSNDDWSSDDEKYAFNFKQATVVYQSLIESPQDIKFYRHRFRKNFKLITKDLPLIGYIPDAVSRENDHCWFYLTRFPPKRVKSMERWCYQVLGDRGKTANDIYSYFRKQLRKHFENDSNRDELVEGSISPVRYLINKRFG